MKVVLREDDSGVSEVVGTILILAMTVVLFSTIIVWVTGIPTPVAQTRVDMLGGLTPLYSAAGSPLGEWINITHQGGESLPAASTLIYVVDQKPGSSSTITDVVHLQLFACTTICTPNGMHPIGGTASGLLDGTGSTWSVGQRFAYYSSNLSVSDTVTVTIVDTARSLVLWTSELTAPVGYRPAIFLSVWASRAAQGGTTLPVESGVPFYLFAQMTAPDKNLNPNSVYAVLSYYLGTSCGVPYKMVDDGSNGDVTPGDGVYTLYSANACTGNTPQAMDNTYVLFNATTLPSAQFPKGLQTTTRLLLHVVPGTTSTGGSGFGTGSGRPPNLLWNGNQGYNLFNASQWDAYGYTAAPTRTFKGSDTVVVVVGSLSLANVFGIDSLNLWNPYSTPAQAVVYGTTKTVTDKSTPSNSSAFSFYQFVNGYYVYTYRFALNTNTSTNFYLPPSNLVPPNYFYGRYSLSMQLESSAGALFSASDSINITTNSGQTIPYPQITTYADPLFLHATSSFTSTSTMYVRVLMPTVELNSSISAGTSRVVFGNLIIGDFSGEHQLFRAPINGYQAITPICPVLGSCSGAAIWSVSTGGSSYYEFAINLARVNQDPWVPGTQNYAFSISSVSDTFNTYVNPSVGIVVQSPLYKMDMVAGFEPSMNAAWGTFDYARFYQDYNGYDAWKSLRVDYCVGTSSISGMNGTGSTCPGKSGQGMPIEVAFGDLFNSGNLDLAESAYLGTSGVVQVYRYTTDASGAVVYLPVKRFYQSNDPCTAIAVGDVTGDGAPDIVCGGIKGDVWYYRNDGNWTIVYVDTTATQGTVTSLTIGDFNGDGANDIAVAGAGYARWYANLNGRGQFRSAVTSYLFASGERIVNGTIASGSYFSTYAVDGFYEQLQEGLVPASIGTGNTSGLDEYWSFPQMPTTATSFALTFYGHRFTGTDNENFTLAYSTNVVGNNPATGTYTKVVTVSSSTDGSYTAILPAALSGKTVWIRAEDTNRTANVTGLDSLYVDQIYILAATAGSSGVPLYMPAGQTVNMIDAGDQNGDGYWDLVAGTSAGNVYKYTGSSSGLQSPAAPFYTTTSGAPVIGVKWGAFSSTYSGLEIAVATGPRVRIIPGMGASTTTVIATLISPGTNTAFGVGDINGDLQDDVVVGTSTGQLVLWENLGNALSWTPAVTIDQIGSQYYSIAIGDTLNSQYVGR